MYSSVGASLLEPEDVAPERIRPLRRTEFELLVNAGAFDEERIELLCGHLVTMSAQTNEHAQLAARLNEVFVKGVPDDYIVRPQLPFALSHDSEPAPDLAICPRSAFHDGHPAAAVLIVEIAGASLALDRGLKLRLYADEEIPEYWIVDAKQMAITVHRDARRGRYDTVTRFDRRARVEPLAFPGLAVCLNDLIRRA
jgi:Uma2 family endonuclease